MEESFLVRLPKGADLLESITRAFQDRSIKKGALNLVGAVDKAVIGYYDSHSREYKNQELPGLLEIVACMGNVSEKDGETFVHAHIVLGRPDFSCAGGHLMPGTIIFAAELYGYPVPGTVPVREFDEPTGLALWSNA